MAMTHADGPVAGADLASGASTARLGVDVGDAPAAVAVSETSDERRYINRELSTLDYYSRVLAPAEDPSVPVLERAKFIAIFSSLLDEFFEIRVAGLKDQLAAGVIGTDPAGLSPSEQLKAIRSDAEALVERRSRTLNDVVIPELAEHGIRLSTWDSLDGDARTYMESVFEDRIFPVLTPLAVDPGHPFPYISNLSLNLAVIVRDPSTGQRR
ncbi:MAG TPA: hypothetical protein VKQ71_02655, partial [Acidimicrobiales bacterium]|nr:hypothetical protein [Acidimicrobiales bacterium]